jgi:hypothetical protein
VDLGEEDGIADMVALFLKKIIPPPPHNCKAIRSQLLAQKLPKNYLNSGFFENDKTGISLEKPEFLA